MNNTQRGQALASAIVLAAIIVGGTIYYALNTQAINEWVGVRILARTTLPVANADGWYPHYVKGNIIMLKSATLPSIGASERYAYGEQVGIMSTHTDLSPEQWMESQELTVDNSRTLSTDWHSSTTYQSLRVIHQTSAEPELVEFVYRHGTMYSIWLYPAKATVEARDLFEKTVCLYTKDCAQGNSQEN